MEAPDLNFVRMHSDDLDELVAMSRSTFTEAYAHLNSVANMEHYLYQDLSVSNLSSELLKEESEFYFVESKGQRVGYLKFNFGKAQNDFKERDGMELERIYVLRNYQKRKIGKSMLSFTLNAGRRRKLKYIWLGVWEINAAAIRFYKKHGFKMIGTHPFQMGDDPQTDCVMRLDLS